MFLDTCCRQKKRLFEDPDPSRIFFRHSQRFIRCHLFAALLGLQQPPDSPFWATSVHARAESLARGGQVSPLRGRRHPVSRVVPCDHAGRALQVVPRVPGRSRRGGLTGDSWSGRTIHLGLTQWLIPHPSTLKPEPFWFSRCVPWKPTGQADLYSTAGFATGAVGQEA